MKIFKYKLPVGDNVSISMPKGAEYLTIQTQYDYPYLWAIVNPENETIEHKFCVRGTGHEFQGNEGNYISTFQMRDSELVFHVFERN